MKILRSFKFLKFIRVQIAGYFLMTSVLLIGLMGMVLYYSITNIMLQDALNNTKDAVEKSSDSITLYVEKLKALTQIIAKDSDVITYLSEPDERGREKVNGLLSNVMATDAQLLTGIIVSRSGEILSNEAALDMKRSSDMMQEPWYIDVMEKGGMPVLTSIRRQTFTMDKSSWVISIGQEVRDDQGQHIGLIILDFSYEVIDRFFEALNLGSEGFAFIITENQALVYHPEMAYFESSDRLEELVRISEMTSGYDEGMNKLTHQSKIEGTDWRLIGVSSLDYLSVARRQLLEVIVVVAIFLILIAMGSGVLIASRISKPIRNLEMAMNDVSKQIETSSDDSSSCYEVESLRLHFDDMRSQIDKLLEGIKEKEQFLRKSEINTLYSQINPHFLYNTLDTILWMAEFNDTEKVVSLTKALAQFFRISLSHGDDFISLENEIDHVKQYLYIQEQRYGEQLRYEIHVDDALYSLKVPKIILQPIVENAIYHGIKPLARPGTVTIHAERISNESEGHTDLLEITITDDGVGFDPSTPADEKSVKLGGVGIENVSRRLSLIYGEAYGVSIHSVLGSGTEVKIKIPVT